MRIDFSNVEEKSVKSTARATVFADLYEFLVEKYGAEYVSQTDSGVYSVAVGEKGDNEVCVDVKVSAKDFMNRQTAKRGNIAAFNRKAATTKYEDKCAERDEKKAANAEKKAAKIKKDSAAREAAAQSESVPFDL